MSGFSGSSGSGGLTPDFDFKASVRVATTVALPAYTQVGNVLTANAAGALPLIDTVALVATNRLLVKNEGGGTSIANGIFVVTDPGSGLTPWILTRSADADTSAEVTAGMVVPVEEGAVNADTLWILATNNPIILNVTPLTFVPFITPVADASTVVKGVVEIATQAEAYAGTPYLGGTGAVLVPSITNLLVRRQDPANALFTVATGVAPAARGTKAIDFQSYRSAAYQVAVGTKSSAFGLSCYGGGVYSVVLGYKNFVPPGTLNGSAVGNRNSATGGGAGPSAFGRLNVVSGINSSGFGYGNAVSGTHGCGFGYKNSITALRSSGFGVLNKATNLKSTVVGYYNHSYAYYGNAFGCLNTVRGTFASPHVSAFGSRNTVGSVGFTAFRSSGFGYGNVLASTAISNYSSAFGYKNTINASDASAFGGKNLVGSAAHTALKSSGFGYGNQIGQTAISDYASAVGYKNTINATNANAFGHNNIIINSNLGSGVGSNNLVGTVAFVAALSSAVGIGNQIAQLAISNQAAAFGAYNTVDNSPSGSAFGVLNSVGSVGFGGGGALAAGYKNHIGQTADSFRSSAVGYKNTINASDASAFGAKNLVGSAAYLGTKSSAFGYYNKIGQTSPSTYSSAFGYYNRVDANKATAVGFRCVALGAYSCAFGSVSGTHDTNASAFGRSNIAYSYFSSSFGAKNTVGSLAFPSPRSSGFGYYNVVFNSSYGSAFGAKNIVGYFAYTATKSSGFGYGNKIGQTAISNYASAVGYKNLVNTVGASACGYKNEITNALFGSAFGSLNLVGSVAYAAFHAICAGYQNKIGQSAQSSLSSAFGHKNAIDALYGSAIGYRNTVNAGAYSSAFGASNLAYGAQSSAFGSNNFANGNFSSSFGRANHADGIESSAFGWNNITTDSRGNTFGSYNTNNSLKGSVIGYLNSVAAVNFACAVGYKNSIPTGPNCSVFGRQNISQDNYANAFGSLNKAGGVTLYATGLAQAFGHGNKVYAASGGAFGVNNLLGIDGVYSATKSSAGGYFNRIGQTANADYASAFGNYNQVNANNASAFGRFNIGSGTRAAAFGAYNTANSNAASAMGNGNYAGYMNASALGRSNSVTLGNHGSAVGSYNTVTASYANAFGRANKAYAANGTSFGYSNFIYATSPNATAVGRANAVRNAAVGSAVGSGNAVGSAAYTALLCSAFGANNLISNLANSIRSSVAGYNNYLNNSTYGSSFGAKNHVGYAAYTANKSSAFGYANAVALAANADSCSAFGYMNVVINSQKGSAFGAQNNLGSGGYTANYSSTFGYGNTLGQAANSDKSNAFGYVCVVAALSANAFGYKAINRITQTTVINGPIMARKDNGEGTTPANKFVTFNGVIVMLESEVIDFTAGAADYEIALPAGVNWFFNEIDIKATNIAALVTQPTVRAGIAGTPAKYLAATPTTLLTATGKRERYTTLLADDAEDSAANLSVGVTVPAAAGTFQGRFILIGVLEEKQ